MKVLRTSAFVDWYHGLGKKMRTRVDARIERIVIEGHYGKVRRFGGITELKWKSGLRVYLIEKYSDLILLLGGNKNGQDKDIYKAKKLFNEINRT